MYKYFVVYMYNNNGGYNFANCESIVEECLSNIERINKLADRIAKDMNKDCVVILNFILLE